MKKKKGFTLVELLAVLVLLSFIIAVAFPNFTQLSGKAKSNYDVSTQILLKSAAKMYVNNNPEAIGDGNNKCIQVGKLVALEYLDSELKKSDGTSISMDQCIRVNKEVEDGKTKYTYSVTDNDTQSGDYYPPLITIRKKTGSTSSIKCSKVITMVEMGDTNTYFDELKEYDNNCEIIATDDNNGNEVSATFSKLIQQKQLNNTTREMLVESDVNTILDNNNSNNIKLKVERVAVVEDNKIFIKYNATDGSNNKAIPLDIQINLPE